MNLKAILFVFAAVGCAAGVWAQPSVPAPGGDGSSTAGLVQGTQPTDQPFRGLFQKPAPLQKNSQHLLVGGSVYGAYDTQVLSALNGGAVGPEDAGYYSGFGSNLEYGKQLARTTVHLGAATSSVYQSHSAADSRLLTSYSGNGGVSIAARGWDVNGTAGVGDSPFYQFALALPIAVDQAAAESPSRQSDASLVAQRVLQTNASASVARTFSQRTSFSATYGMRAFSFRDVTTDLNTTFHDGTAGFLLDHHLNQVISLRAGYGYHFGRTTVDSNSLPIRSHDLDTGIRLDKPLSRSRRTRLALSTGAAIFTSNTIGSPEQGDQRQHYTVATGDAQLTHDIGRTWGATAGFQRSVQYAPGFLAPLIGNTASAALGGYLNARAHFGVSGYYSFGSVGASGVANGYDNVNGSARFTVAAARHLNLFTEYVFYHYRFEQDVQLPLAFPVTGNRHGVRVGLSTSIPLLGLRENERR